MFFQTSHHNQRQSTSDRFLIRIISFNVKKRSFLNFFFGKITIELKGKWSMDMKLYRLNTFQMSHHSLLQCQTTNKFILIVTSSRIKIRINLMHLTYFNFSKPVVAQCVELWLALQNSGFNPSYYKLEQQASICPCKKDPATEMPKIVKTLCAINGFGESLSILFKFSMNIFHLG
jgi:hypothetical protein